MIKAIITFIFGNTFWDYLVDFFGSTEEIIKYALLPLAISALFKYVKDKFNSSNNEDIPKNANYYFQCGLSKQNIGDYPQAIQYYNKAIELNPNDAYAYNNRGFSYLNLKQYELAIKDYTKSIELNNPELYLPYYNRGKAYIDGLKQYELAIQDCTKAIQLNPNYVDAYICRGVAYNGMKQYEREIQDYDKAIQLNPNYALAYNNRGWAYYCMKNYEKALKDLDKALEIDPNHTLSKINREACLKAMGK